MRPGLASTSHCALGDDAGFAASVATSFRDLANEYVGRRPGRVSAITAILGLVLIHAARAAGTAQPGFAARDRFRHRMERFSELIDRHFREWRPVGFYAHRLGVSTAQLNNSCRRESGRSAQHLIHERLLLEARRLLAYSDLDVTAISYSLGFKDPAYFSRFFTRREAMSPSAFRRRHSFDAAA